MYCRKTSTGHWIIGNGRQTPIVLSPSSCKNQNEAKAIAQSVEGFDTPLSEPIPGETKIWRFLRLSLWGLLILSLLTIAYCFERGGIPSGNWWNIPHSSLLDDILIIALVGFSTTLVHEMGHVLFGRSWRLTAKMQQLTMRTNINHVWSWPRAQRIEAISAGLIFDTVILAILLTVHLLTLNPLAASAASTVFLRITWQFGFHKVRDGRLLIVLALDKPLLFASPYGKREKWLKTFLVALGHMMDITLIWHWPVSAALSTLNPHA